MLLQPNGLDRDLLPQKNKGKKKFLIYLSLLLSRASIAEALHSRNLVGLNDRNYAIGSGFNTETRAICGRSGTYESPSSP